MQNFCPNWATSQTISFTVLLNMTKLLLCCRQVWQMSVNCLRISERKTKVCVASRWSTLFYQKFATNLPSEHFHPDVSAGGRGSVRDVRHLLRLGAAPRQVVRKNSALGTKVSGGVGRPQLPQHVFRRRGGSDEEYDWGEPRGALQRRVSFAGFPQIDSALKLLFASLVGVQLLRVHTHSNFFPFPLTSSRTRTRTSGWSFRSAALKFDLPSLHPLGRVSFSFYCYSRRGRGCRITRRQGLILRCHNFLNWLRVNENFMLKKKSFQGVGLWTSKKSYVSFARVSATVEQMCCKRM